MCYCECAKGWVLSRTDFDQSLNFSANLVTFNFDFSTYAKPNTKINPNQLNE